MSLYRFKDKDPIIDVLKVLIDTRASMEGRSFRKVLLDIDAETKREVRHETLYSWFKGPTKHPRYESVARLYLAMRAYSRKPIQIGDTAANPVNLLAVPRRKVA